MSGVERIDDGKLKLLVIEALDHNAQVISLCTAFFGNTDRKSSADRFIKEHQRITKLTESRRQEILGGKNNYDHTDY